MDLAAMVDPMDEQMGEDGRHPLGKTSRIAFQDDDGIEPLFVEPVADAVSRRSERRWAVYSASPNRAQARNSRWSDQALLPAIVR